MMRRRTNNELIDSIIVGHEENNNKEKIYVNTIHLDDLCIKLTLLLLILTSLFTFVFYMYITINEHRDFMNKTTETLYAFSPDSRVLNWVLQPQSSPDNIIPSIISQITATIHCTPPRASPSVSPVLKNVIDPLLQDYSCPYKSTQEIPTDCYANAFYQDPTTNNIESCFDSTEIESPCLIMLLHGLDNGIIDLDSDKDYTSAWRFDQTIRFIQPNPRESGMEYDSLCPLRSVEELDDDTYLSKGPPYSINIKDLTKYGHSDIPDLLPPSSKPLLGTTISSAAMHMSTVPFVQEMAGIQFYVYDNEIVEVEFYINVGNVVYRPDLFYDTNDAWSLSFRSVPTAYTIYPVCRAYESPVGNEKLQCKIANQFHAEYSFSQENNRDLTDPNVYNEYTIPKVGNDLAGDFTGYVWRQNTVVDNGYYNRFSSTRKIRTVFQTRDIDGSYLVECHPVLIWDVPDLTVPTPPSIQDSDYFTCTSHASVFTSYPADIVDKEMADNTVCQAYRDNNKLCGESVFFPGVEHCARKINNAGLFTIHSDSSVSLIATSNPRNINVQFKEATSPLNINNTYIKNQGELQMWCNINPLTNFTTPGWSNQTYSQNMSCCTKQASYLFGGDGLSFEQPESSNLCNFGSSTPTVSSTRTPTPSRTPSQSPTPSASKISGIICQYTCTSQPDFSQCFIGSSTCPTVTDCTLLAGTPTDSCLAFTSTSTPSHTPTNTITPTVTPIPGTGMACIYNCDNANTNYFICFQGENTCQTFSNCVVGNSYLQNPCPITPFELTCQYSCSDNQVHVNECFIGPFTCPLDYAENCDYTGTLLGAKCSITSTPTRTPSQTPSITPSPTRTSSRSRSQSVTSTRTPASTVTPTRTTTPSSI